MARILCAWEFGSGLGHLTRLLPIARKLHDAGHEIVLAVPNPPAAKPVLDKNFPEREGPFRLKVIKGTLWQIPTEKQDPNLRRKPTHVLADVLTLFHYQDAVLLERQTRVWQQICDEVDPDLIVADFAPTLRLAYWGRAPFAMMGNGYTTPPRGRLLPPIKPWQSGLLPFSRRHEASVLMAMNHVRDVLKGPAVDYVGDMLNGDRSFVCTIREFDPYRPHRTEPTLMPFNVPDVSRHPTIEERGGDKAPIFIYLPANHPLLRGVLNMVSKSGVPAHVYVSNVPPEQIAGLCGRNVSIHRNPINFANDLWKFRMIIHHAGLATAYAAIKAGTPQLMLPVNLEHSITSRGAAHLAGASVMGAADSPKIEEVEQAYTKMLTDRTLWRRAHEAALKVAERPVQDSVGMVVQGCLEMLEQGLEKARREADKDTGEDAEDVDRIMA